MRGIGQMEEEEENEFEDDDPFARKRKKARRACRKRCSWKVVHACLHRGKLCIEGKTMTTRKRSTRTTTQARKMRRRTWTNSNRSPRAYIG